MLDVFNKDVFKTVSLTQAVQTLPYQPGRLRAMGLFRERGITTNTAVIENMDGVLSLVATKRRGEPPTLAKRGTRKARSFLIPHIPLQDEILASDLSGVRAFGSEDQLQAIAQIVNDRLQEMVQSIETTIEYHLVGAIQGRILDADGSTVVYNLFDEFGVVQQEVDFVLGTGTTDIRGKCLSVKRKVENAIGNSTLDHVHIFASSGFFDKFTGHAEVKEAFKRSSENNFAINDPRKGFSFADIVIEEYRGQIGDVPFVKANEAIAIPIGTTDAFSLTFAPGEFVEAVNTVGLNRYAKQELLELSRGIKLHVESNPLAVCNRPLSLIRCFSSN